MKNQKGITLVAIIVTIIVMLILAGVSVNMAIMENGILEQSTAAVDKTELAEEKEFILETWAYVLFKYEDISFLTPTDSGKSNKDFEKEIEVFENALGLYSKYFSNYGECKLLPVIGSFNDGKKINTVMCVESKLKGAKELKTYYIVNDTKVYEKTEFVKLYPDIDISSMFRNIGSKKDVIIEEK